MGCQICNALNRNGDLEQCQSGMFYSFDYLQKDHGIHLDSLGQRKEVYLEQLRDLPYCSNNPEVQECRGAKPLDEAQRAKAQGVSQHNFLI